MTSSSDIAVVGAGAAGLMSAIAAHRQNPGVKIRLYDSRKIIGAKILMSGGTRCNVTNRAVTESDYQGGPRHFVRHVLKAFPLERTRDFFRSVGVELALEPEEGKYFPTTHLARSVLEALTREARAGAELVTEARIGSVQKRGDKFLVGEDEASRVILCTGGLSYPDTGSDGGGIEIARSLGHRIVPTSPALTPLLTNDPDWKALSGLSLKARLSYYKEGRKAAETRGSFLFTHFGFSGPAVLDISRHWARAGAAERPAIEAEFFEPWPKRFKDVFLAKVGATPRGRPGRAQGPPLHHLVKHYPLPVTGVFGYRKAEATAGGVDLAEVNVSSMESKKVPGLYFAGEMLDADGRIGGFNFQWAWSTGWIAGSSAAGSLGGRFADGKTVC